MDVDHRAACLVQEVVREHLHVARHHHEVGIVRVHDLELLGLGFGLRLFSSRAPGRTGCRKSRRSPLRASWLEMMHASSPAISPERKRRDRVVEAVINLRHEQGDFGAIRRFRDFDRHAEVFVGEFLKASSLFVDLTRRCPFHMRWKKIFASRSLC